MSKIVGLEELSTVLAGHIMTDAQITKLAGIEADANNYTLPAATDQTLGGVKQGTNITIAADGTISATDTTYSAATQSAAGLMSAADKTKLDGVATGANNYSLPIAAADTLGGIKVGTNLSIDSNGVLSASSGSYTLPEATTTTLGGIKVGTNLSIDGSGVLSATDTTYSVAVPSVEGQGGTNGLMSATDKEKLNTYGALATQQEIEAAFGLPVTPTT